MKPPPIVSIQMDIDESLVMFIVEIKGAHVVRKRGFICDLSQWKEQFPIMYRQAIEWAYLQQRTAFDWDTDTEADKAVAELKRITGMDK